MAEEPKVPYNTADPAHVKGRKRKVDLARERELNDLRQVLATAQGRRVFWRLLAFTRLFANEFSVDPYQNAFLSGNRNPGNWLWAEVMEACPERFAEAQAENKPQAEPEPQPQEDETDG